MPKIPAYLYSRHNIWYFYYRIPSRIRRRYGLKEKYIRKSLCTSNRREAVLLSRDYMVKIMADEKSIDDIEEAISKQNDLMVTGRKLVDEYNSVLKYGSSDEQNDFFAHMSEYQFEAFKYASEIIDQNETLLQKDSSPNVSAYEKIIASLIADQQLSRKVVEGHSQENPTVSSNVSSITLGDLVDEFISFKKSKGDWKARTGDGNAQMLYLIKDFLECIIGIKNPMIHLFENKHAIQFEEKFSKYPKNCKKKYPNKSMGDVLAMIDNGQININERISPNRYNEYAQILMAMFGWAKNDKKRRYLEGDCVFTQLKVKGVPPKSYDPFTDDELMKFFNHEIYSLKKFKINFSWRFWVPVIMMYHGMRLEEVTQLLIKNVIKNDGVWCFDIKDEKDANGKILTTTKGKGNRSGERVVPIHSKVIKIGFLRYVEFQKKCGKEKLFPTLSNVDKNGEYKQSGADVSKYFNEDDPKQKKRSFFTTVGIDKINRNLVLYSFRHTAETLLMNHPDRIEHDKFDVIIGHTVKSTGRLHYGKYTPQTLLSVVNKIDYPNANLPWDVNKNYNDLPFPWE